MKPFDPTKPCQTRDGKSVRILCTDVNNSKPIIALILMEDGKEYSYYYFVDGKSSKNQEFPYDLINIPEKHEMWINVYSKSTDGFYCVGDGCFTKEQADKEASGVPFRMACIKVTFEEGEGL